MVLTDVFADSCMSEGPKSVAPVSEPATAAIAESVRCSMKGRSTIMRSGIQTPHLR